MTLDPKALKRGLDDLRAHASRGLVSSREIFTLTDPLMDMIARSETAPSGQAPLEVVKPLDKLAREYRPTMDKDVLHSWAADVVSALLHANAEPVAEQESGNHTNWREDVQEAINLIEGGRWLIAQGVLEDLLSASPPASGAVEAGWPRKGDKMRFLGKNGYPSELDEALATMEIWEVVTVSACKVDSFSSSISFEEYPRKWWNSVMFEALPAAPTEGR